MIWSLIVGALIGMAAGAITSKGSSMGCIANIVAGLLGSFVGQKLLGNWGPQLAGMSLIPSIVGAIIVVLVASALFGKKDNYNVHRSFFFIKKTSNYLLLV